MLSSYTAYFICFIPYFNNKVLIVHFRLHKCISNQIFAL